MKTHVNHHAWMDFMKMMIKTHVQIVYLTVNTVTMKAFVKDVFQVLTC